MLLKLTDSKLFTEDPALRFAREYQVSPKVWNELWRRYGLLEYDYDGLCGYFLLKTGRRANQRSLKRWIVRTEIYCKAQHVMRMGVETVDSAYFGTFEEALLYEISKGMRFGGSTDSKIII